MKTSKKQNKLKKKVSEVINLKKKWRCKFNEKINVGEVEGKKDKDKLPIFNKRVKNLISTSTKIRIKNVLKPKVQKATSTDIISSPKKHVETVLEETLLFCNMISLH